MCGLELEGRHGLGGRRGVSLVVLVVDAAGAEHEAVHAHAEVLALGLEALPHEHASPARPRNLAGVCADVVRVTVVAVVLDCWKKTVQWVHVSAQGY